MKFDAFVFGISSELCATLGNLLVELWIGYAVLGLDFRKNDSGMTWQIADSVIEKCEKYFDKTLDKDTVRRLNSCPK